MTGKRLSGLAVCAASTAARRVGRNKKEEYSKTGAAKADGGGQKHQQPESNVLFRVSCAVVSLETRFTGFATAAVDVDIV